MDNKEKILYILDLLEAQWHYEENPPDLGHKEPLDGLILAVLSQNTNDKNRDFAFQRLKAKFPEWEQVAKIGVKELESVIRPAGLAPTKARKILEILKNIHKDFGEYSIKKLALKEREYIWEYLTKMDGVGVKTASCVLLFDMKIAAFPVDTHVSRIARRTGVVPENITTESISPIFEKIVPPERCLGGHVNMIAHGRSVCRSQRPLCEKCVLDRICNWKKSESGGVFFTSDFEYKSNALRSSEITNNIARSGQRALLYATGMDEEDFKKPFVAVVNSYSEIVPGHTHLRDLAEQVKLGISENGGVPKEFNTIAICDGLCQGHSGMRYPLPSRDLIADSVEMAVQAHCFDAMVLIASCDKIIPGMLMAAARINIPSIIVTGGPMLPGSVEGNDLFCSSELREFPGRLESGKITPKEMKQAEKDTLPTCGSCAHLGTANSMCMLSEVLGMALPGAGTAPAVSNKRRRIAKQSGRQVMELLKNNITPRRILTRETFLNGISGAMATGSSTNLVLHLMAIAHEAGVVLSLDDFDRISRDVPFICNLQPSGKYPIVSLDKCGGIQSVMKNIESKLYGETLTVTGKLLRELLRNALPVDNDIIKSTVHPQKTEGGIAVLYGNLAPEGAVVKQSGVNPEMYKFKGRARVFNSMEEADAAITGNEIKKNTVIVIRYEGPKGGPGMREMLSTTALIMGRGMDHDCALVTDGRFSGATHGPCIGHVSPEAAQGGPIAFVKDGDEIEIDIENRSLKINVSEKEFESRKKGWNPAQKFMGPALRKYAAHVSSASKGAIIEI